MSIDEYFNRGQDRPKEDPLPPGAVRQLLGGLLDHQQEITGETLPEAERKAYLDRCRQILRNPIRRPDPFCARRIEPHELYLDVSETLFVVADEGSTFDWLGTPGAEGCGALALRAHGTQTAPATTCLALLKPEDGAQEIVESMLECFDASHEVFAVLAGRDIHLDLAATVTSRLRAEGIKLNAHLGTHSAIAVNVASGDLVASPELPGPVRKMREMLLPCFFERTANPDKPYMMRLYYDARSTSKEEARTLDHDPAPGWQPD